MSSVTEMPPQRERSKPAEIASDRPSTPNQTALASRRPTPHSRRRRWLVASLGCLAVAVLGVFSYQSLFAKAKFDQMLIYHTVQRGDLEIEVTERGNLESQDEVRVVCEVDDVRGDGINGTPILWIIENGASVKEGDLIVELDSAPHQDRLDDQTLDVEQARAEAIQARVAYENRKTQNETNLAEAKLQVELAELALKQFGDEDGGTFQIELQDVKLQVQEAEAGLLIEKNNLRGVEQLYKLGYRSGAEVAQARLNTLRSERQLATSISRHKELIEYQYKKMSMELEGKLASARRSLEQIARDNEAELEQARARMESAEERFRKEQELFERFAGDVENCKIYAPQDGMIAYATGESRWHREEIRAGAPVRPQQAILTIPNLRRMQVKTLIHESVLDKIQKGQPATITVDAFPDKRYVGSVQSVAVLPDQGGWLSSDTKVYETVVQIDEDVQMLKPGMTAVVQIHVDHLQNVLTVPIQSIVQVQGDSWCFAQSGNGIERRAVTLADTDDKFVVVDSGLQEHEVVVLNPKAIQSGFASDSNESNGVENADADRPSAT
ncbi:MAG: efflux RND transporter periplasmic adaptor subunit [Pirellulaceae bacterium]